MRVVLSALALDDIRSIGDYIGRDNPDRASSFVLELRGACADLGHMAEAYPIVPELQSRGIRRRVYGRYVVLYRIAGSDVRIMRVVQGSRDWQSLV